MKGGVPRASPSGQEERPEERVVSRRGKNRGSAASSVPPSKTHIISNYIVIGPILWYHFSKIRAMIKSIQQNKMESVSDNDDAVPSTNNNNNNINDNYIYNLIQVRSPTFIYIISIVSFIGIFIERPLLCIVRVLQFNIIQQ